jgi:L-malate glycosyltransferase
MPRDVAVLHLITHLGIGGSERQFVERLRAHPRGFSPVVACLRAGGALLEQVRALGHEPAVFPVTGLVTPRVVLPLAKLAAFARSRNVRIVHSTEFTSNLVAVPVARLSGAKSIVCRADVGHLRPGFGVWHRRAEALGARLADAVSANAEAVRRVCIEEEGCAPERVAMVRNGIDLARFDSLAAQPLQGPLPEGGPLVALVGNLWPVKGHRILVEAAALLHRRLPQAKIVCVGEGPERTFLERRIAELGLSDSVFLLGHRLDVPALLTRAQAAVLCSSAEGLSNAIIEAMTARLPVVATDVGGNSELVRPGENGWLVPYGDPDALASALFEALSDAERARRMGRRGRERVEAELTLERMRETHEDLYRRVLGQPSERRAADPLAA